MNFVSIFMFPNVFQLLNFVHSAVFFHPSLLLIDSSIHCHAVWVTATTHKIGSIPHTHTHTQCCSQEQFAQHNGENLYKMWPFVCWYSHWKSFGSSFRGSSTLLTLTFLTRICQFLLFFQSGSFKLAVLSFL